MSASPATQGYLNGRPKSLSLKKDTCSSIKSQINQIIPQLFTTRATLNIISPALFCLAGFTGRENYTTTKMFRPTFSVRGFSLARAASTAESGLVTPSTPWSPL